jgi:hypothetical protein
MEEYIHTHIKGGCRGVQDSLAWFNNWLCFLHEPYIRFRQDLKWFQEPMLELHFIISNQRRLTRDHKAKELACTTRAAEKTRAAESSLPRGLKKHKSS